MTGGVAVLDGGLLGRLIEGLSHDEKKSSPGSPEGVESPAVLAGAMISVITTSLGYLDGQRSVLMQDQTSLPLTPVHPPRRVALARPCTSLPHWKCILSLGLYWPGQRSHHATGSIS